MKKIINEMKNNGIKNRMVSKQFVKTQLSILKPEYWRTLKGGAYLELAYKVENMAGIVDGVRWLVVTISDRYSMKTAGIKIFERYKHGAKKAQRGETLPKRLEESYWSTEPKQVKSTQLEKGEGLAKQLEKQKAINKELIEEIESMKNEETSGDYEALKELYKELEYKNKELECKCKELAERKNSAIDKTEMIKEATKELNGLEAYTVGSILNTFLHYRKAPKKAKLAWLNTMQILVEEVKCELGVQSNE